jgi:hypothetical protein
MAAFAHSYADPVTGCVHLTLRDVGGEFHELVESSRGSDRDDDYRSGLYEYAWTRHPSLLIHEWAHVLQLATYPLLFLRAARRARIMVGIPTYLAQHPDEYPLPLGFELDASWATVVSTIPFITAVTDEGIDYRPVTDGSVRRGMLSERDLVEEDATVFQYRAETGASERGAAYRRWLHEGKHYRQLFSFLARHFEDDDDALHALPLLARVAYRTTRPIEAFVRSFAYLLSVGLPADPSEDEELESELFDHLRDAMGSVDPSALTLARADIDDPVGVIEPGTFVRLAASFEQLPIAPLAQINLDGNAEQRGVATRALAEPWDFFERGEAAYDPRLGDYLPPAIIVALDDPGFASGSSVLAFSDLLRSTPFGPAQAISYAEWTSVLLQTRWLSKAVIDGATGPNPSCPHDGCEFHPTGLCHGWHPVPNRPADCQFPTFLTATTKHRLRADGSVLEPIARREDEDTWT